MTYLRKQNLLVFGCYISSLITRFFLDYSTTGDLTYAINTTGLTILLALSTLIVLKFSDKLFSYAITIIIGITAILITSKVHGMVSVIQFFYIIFLVSKSSTTTSSGGLKLAL